MSAHAIALNLCQVTVNRQSQVMSNIALALRCNTSSPDADISSNTAQATPTARYCGMHGHVERNGAMAA
jgi:hypothetical protein